MYESKSIFGGVYYLTVLVYTKTTNWHLRAIFSECRESEDSQEKSIFLLFRQNIPLGELIQGKIV